jgi:hypothetical protein
MISAEASTAPTGLDTTDGPRHHRPTERGSRVATIAIPPWASSADACPSGGMDRAVESAHTSGY